MPRVLRWENGLYRHQNVPLCCCGEPELCECPSLCVEMKILGGPNPTGCSKCLCIGRDTYRFSNTGPCVWDGSMTCGHCYNFIQVTINMDAAGNIIAQIGGSMRFVGFISQAEFCEGQSTLLTLHSDDDYLVDSNCDWTGVTVTVEFIPAGEEETCEQECSEDCECPCISGPLPGFATISNIPLSPAGCFPLDHPNVDGFCVDDGLDMYQVHKLGSECCTNECCTRGRNYIEWRNLAGQHIDTIEEVEQETSFPAECQNIVGKKFNNGAVGDCISPALVQGNLVPDLLYSQVQFTVDCVTDAPNVLARASWTIWRNVDVVVGSHSRTLSTPWIDLGPAPVNPLDFGTQEFNSSSTTGASAGIGRVKEGDQICFYNMVNLVQGDWPSVTVS